MSRFSLNVLGALAPRVLPREEVRDFALYLLTWVTRLLGNFGRVDPDLLLAASRSDEGSLVLIRSITGRHVHICDAKFAFMDYLVNGLLLRLRRHSGPAGDAAELDLVVSSCIRDLFMPLPLRHFVALCTRFLPLMAASLDGSGACPTRKNRSRDDAM